MWAKPTVVPGNYGKNLPARVDKASEYVLNRGEPIRKGKKNKVCGYHGKQIQENNFHVRMSDVESYSYNYAAAITINKNSDGKEDDAFIAGGVKLGIGSSTITAVYDGPPIEGVNEDSKRDGIPDLAIEITVSSWDMGKAVLANDMRKAIKGLPSIDKCTGEDIAEFVNEHMVELDRKRIVLFNGVLEYVVRRGTLYVASK
jgi:hypothetical protein